MIDTASSRTTLIAPHGAKYDSVRCPVCCAAPKQKCRNARGLSIETKVHAERAMLYNKQGDYSKSSS